LTAPTLWNFYALIGLYVAFGVVTSIFIALLSIYVPHCMRVASHDESTRVVSDASGTDDANKSPAAKKARRYGFAMSVFGMVASSVAAIVILAIVTALSGTLTGTTGQNAGLLVTTIVGFITVAASIGSFLGLPALPAKPTPAVGLWKSALHELFTPLKLLWVRKNMFVLLLAYTIYTDTSFATSSIVSQLYFTELTPSTLEFSLYSLATNIFNLVCLIAFYVLHQKFHFNLEKCMIFGYAWVLIVPVWGIIGIADQSSFGDKVTSITSPAGLSP
jgi:MFS-type transporter involved in bile tolerance (Atg22 family)